jgi:signal transduction histidine kinase
VASHGGTIEVSSDADRGTVFQVKIALDKDATTIA